MIRVGKNICNKYDKVLISLLDNDSCEWMQDKKYNREMGTQDDLPIIKLQMVSKHLRRCCTTVVVRDMYTASNISSKEIKRYFLSERQEF